MNDPQQTTVGQTKRCPYCGEEILAAAKKCKHCGEWLDASARPQSSGFQQQSATVDNVAQSAAPEQDFAETNNFSQNISRWQTLASVLMVLGIVLLMPLRLFGLLLVREEVIQNTTPYITLASLPLLIGAAMLIWLARNKGTRVGAIVLFADAAWQELYGIIFSLDVIPSVGVQTAISVIRALAIIYALSLIIQNGRLSAINQTWVSILAVLASNAIIMSMMSLWASGFYHDSAFVFQPDDFFPNTMFNGWLYFFVLVMFAVAYWRLGRSEAFAGSFDAEAEPCYQPLNKWMAMGVIAPFVTGVALYLLYSGIGRA